MAFQLLRQSQVEGLGSNPTLMDQMSNLSKAYTHTITIPQTGANQTFAVGTAYEIGGKVLKVFYNGQLQHPGVSYNEIDNYNIQFPDMVYQNDLLHLLIDGAGSGTAFVSDHGHQIREVMTGTIDGTNKVFVTAKLPMDNKEELYLNGVLQSPTDDYTISYNTPSGQATVTFVNAPAATAKVVISYLYAIQS